MSKSITRFKWERRLCSNDGPPSPVTRHVALAVATHADREGYAYPSMRLLATETALSERAVVLHVQMAVEQGWLTCRQAAGQGQAWKRNIYRLSIPEGAAPRSAPLPPQGTDRHAAPTTAEGTQRVILAEGTDPGAEGAARHSEGTDFDDKKVLHHVHTNIVLNTSKNIEKNISGEKPFFNFPPSKPEQPKTATPSLDAKQIDSLAGWARSLGRSRLPDEPEHVWLASVKEALRDKAKSDDYAARCYTRIFPSEHT